MICSSDSKPRKGTSGAICTVRQMPEGTLKKE